MTEDMNVLLGQGLSLAEVRGREPEIDPFGSQSPCPLGDALGISWGWGVGGRLGVGVSNQKSQVTEMLALAFSSWPSGRLGYLLKSEVVMLVRKGADPISPSFLLPL